jgi:hypothetical protein
MTWTDSRPALIANVCALAVASVVAMEGHYIVQARLGMFRPFDIWGAFVPALVMFIVRGRIFSWCFLFLYVALSIQMVFQARSIYFGVYRYAGEKDPLEYLGLFFVISIWSLAIYAAGALIWFVVNRRDNRSAL